MSLDLGSQISLGCLECDTQLSLTEVPPEQFRFGNYDHLEEFRPIPWNGSNPKSTVDLKEIKSIIDLMKKNSLSEFELEEKDFKIKLKRPIGVSGPMLGGPVDDPELTAYSSLARQSAATVPGAHAHNSSSAGPESEIKSPMIGTFYNTPSPDAAPYVEIGSEVGPETVVCILEAMKVMNEIKAEARGIITSMVAENGKPVEFGQVLFKIRPL